MTKNSADRHKTVKNKPVFRFNDVRKTVQDENGQPLDLLLGINGDIEAGSVTALIGPSGAGKSTLLALCNGLDSPTEGQITAFEQPLSAWDMQALRRKVGLVFQTPTMLPGTVEDNLRAAARVAAPEKQQAPLSEYLESVSLPQSLLKRDADELSGGQQQRVALARTLIAEPEVLLLDEVTSALDVSSVQVVEDVIMQIHRQSQVTLVWVTHDLRQAERVADTIWLMENGQVIEQSPAGTFFASPATALGQTLVKGGSA